MSAEIIDGRQIAQQYRQELAEKITRLQAEKGITPGLRVVLIGDDPASHVYVNNKQKAAESVGINSSIERFDADVPHDAVAERIQDLRNDPNVHGILVQWPVPPQIRYDELIDLIGPDKDVDGFHPYNLGSLAGGHQRLVACTPLGIMNMLRTANISVAGKHAVVVGRSKIVGRPMSYLLLNANATVTVVHSYTRQMEVYTRQADILVVAAGRANLIDGSMIRPGATVIDVGINRLEGRLVGDVHFESAQTVAGAITPVPGGVGPMTIAMLLENTYRAATGAYS